MGRYWSPWLLLSLVGVHRASVGPAEFRGLGIEGFGFRTQGLGGPCTRRPVVRKPGTRGSVAGDEEDHIATAGNLDSEDLGFRISGLGLGLSVFFVSATAFFASSLPHRGLHQSTHTVYAKTKPSALTTFKNRWEFPKIGDPNIEP